MPWLSWDAQVWDGSKSAGEGTRPWSPWESLSSTPRRGTHLRLVSTPFPHKGSPSEAQRVTTYAGFETPC